MPVFPSVLGTRTHDRVAPAESETALVVSGDEVAHLAGIARKLIQDGVVPTGSSPDRLLSALLTHYRWRKRTESLEGRARHKAAKAVAEAAEVQDPTVIDESNTSQMGGDAE